MLITQTNILNFILNEHSLSIDAYSGINSGDLVKFVLISTFEWLNKGRNELSVQTERSVKAWDDLSGSDDLIRHELRAEQMSQVSSGFIA